jgi:hypothetical protein
MSTIQARPAQAAFMSWRMDARDFDPWPVHPRLRRRFASPLLAAMLLTAAIFVLPAAGGRSGAEAAYAGIKAAATHMEHDVSVRLAPVRE